jgi:hypothetical protein
MVHLQEKVVSSPVVNHERELLNTEHLADTFAKCWELGNEEDEKGITHRLV